MELLFSQYTWNKLNAIDRVKNDPKISIAFNSTDQEMWARRNHYLRLIEIGKIFPSVFGSTAYISKWTIFSLHYDTILNWANIVFGIAPSKYLYALAQTHYFSDTEASAHASVQQILAAVKNSSDNGYVKTLQIGEIASVWGLKLAAYEAGPGMNVGDTTNIDNRIEAQRNPAIKQIAVDDILKSWFGLPRPGDFFSLADAYIFLL